MGKTQGYAQKCQKKDQCCTHSSFPLNAALEEIAKAVRMKIAIKKIKRQWLKKNLLQMARLCTLKLQISN